MRWTFSELSSIALNIFRESTRKSKIHFLNCRWIEPTYRLHFKHNFDLEIYLFLSLFLLLLLLLLFFLLLLLFDAHYAQERPSEHTYTLAHCRIAHSTETVATNTLERTISFFFFSSFEQNKDNKQKKIVFSFTAKTIATMMSSISCSFTPSIPHYLAGSVRTRREKTFSTMKTIKMISMK